MVDFDYSPFRDDKGNFKTIQQITYDDLKQLKEKDIEEGDKVEYKSLCPLTVTVGGFNSPQLFHNALCVPVPFEF